MIKERKKYIIRAQYFNMFNDNCRTGHWFILARKMPSTVLMCPLKLGLGVRRCYHCYLYNIEWKKKTRVHFPNGIILHFDAQVGKSWLISRRLSCVHHTEYKCSGAIAAREHLCFHFDCAHPWPFASPISFSVIWNRFTSCVLNFSRVGRK